MCVKSWFCRNAFCLKGYESPLCNLNIAHIRTQAFSGVTPNGGISVFRILAGTAMVGEPRIGLMHPAGFLSPVKFIQAVDSVDMIAAVKGCPAGSIKEKVQK